jgi:hypothetical protein
VWPGSTAGAEASDRALYTAKRLELLRAVVPAATRVAILGDDANSSRAISVRDAHAAAQALGIALLALPARAAADVDRALAPAVIVQPATLFFTERRRVVELAARHRLPAAYGTETRMKATRHGAGPRLLQAWLVPRCTSTSPARRRVSPSSISAQISPLRTIA